MASRLILLAVLSGLILMPLGAATGPAYGQAGQAPEMLPGTVLVGFETGQAQPTLNNLEGLSVALRVGDSVVYRMAVQPGQEIAAAQALGGRPGVAFAEPDFLAHALDSVEPDDPSWPQQWGPQAIGAPAAWAVVTGTRAITVAVVDSGIALNHPDLHEQLWTNPGEVPANGVDDDGNGKVDDVHGWHFFHSWDGLPQGDANVQDDFGHGTHVAGIIAAAGNNGVGIAGLAWNATLLPVKALDANGSGTYSEIAGGITYAVDEGARIINVSAGGTASGQLLCAAVAYARQRGRLVVVSAGNDGGPVLYPAACPGALAVAATGRDGERWAGSNYGPQMALSAPGVNIYSTWPWVGGYFTQTGTSMAAPHVSGVAALIWSRWPGWSGISITHQLTATAADLGSPGWDEYTGWGRVDAARSVEKSTFPHEFYFPAVRRRP